MYAVVSSGGKQYRVEPGSLLTIERLSLDAGARVTFDRVLLVGDGDAVTVGTPTVSDAVVTGTVVGEALGPKLIVFKFKQKVKYRRTTGHRQHLMRVRVDEISAGGRTESAPEAEAPKRSAKPKAGGRRAEGGGRQPKRASTKAGGTKAGGSKAGGTKAAATKRRGAGAAARGTKKAPKAAGASDKGVEDAGAEGTRRAARPKDETPEKTKE